MTQAEKNRVAWIRTERRQDGRNVPFLLRVIEDQEKRLKKLEAELTAHKSALQELLALPGEGV